MDKIAALDREGFLWVNGLHTAWLDPVMLLLTKTWIWLPLYVVLAGLIYKKRATKTIFILIAAALAIALADRITSGLMKPWFARLRPTHEPALRDLVHTVGGYTGGEYGFASSHAANVFAAAVLLWLVLRKDYPLAGLIFIWAAFVSYTRIYLGVHYPGDVIAGAVVGGLCGAGGYALFQWYDRRHQGASA